MAKARVMRRTETGEMQEVDVKPIIMTDELAALIGTQAAPIIMEVERGAIRRYAEAMEDPNPLYHDREYARKSKYGEIIAPPGFFGWPVKPFSWMRDPSYLQIREKAGTRVVGMDNGGEIEFILPIRAGDTLTAVRQIADIYEEIGRSGNRLLLTLSETTYINQNGDVVAKGHTRAMYVPVAGGS